MPQDSRVTIGIWAVLYSVIPVSAAALSQENLIQWLQTLSLLPPAWTVGALKMWAAIIGGVYGIFILSLPLAVRTSSLKVLRDQSGALIENTAGFYLHSLKLKGLFSAANKINTRIFIPRLQLSNRYPFWRKVFALRNIPSLATKDITEGMAIEVYPQQQGLVGLSYHTKQVQYDDNLEETNTTNYSFNEIQARRTAQLKFSMTVPVLNSENRVEAILAFDSDGFVQIADGRENELKSEVAHYAQDLYDKMPNLFTRKGGCPTIK